MNLPVCSCCNTVNGCSRPCACSVCRTYLYRTADVTPAPLPARSDTAPTRLKAVGKRPSTMCRRGDHLTCRTARAVCGCDCHEKAA